MPRDRTLIIGGVIFVVLIILASIAGKLLSRGQPTQAQLIDQQSVIATIYPPTGEIPTETVSTETPNPNDFSGSWFFVKMDGKQASGILKGHDIGVFTSDDGSQRITAVCSAPLSPAPKKGDEFKWDPSTNILYPVHDNAQGNIQRFWYPTRTGG